MHTTYLLIFNVITPNAASYANFITKKLPKYLVVSEKGCTFAEQIRNDEHNTNKW
jgi:hypothetical protein